MSLSILERHDLSTSMANRDRPQTPRPPLDLDRVGRAITLRVEPLENMPGKYLVYGDAEPHYVDLRAGEEWGIEYYTCDCGDYEWRDALCKHICAALIAENDDEAVRLMYEWIRRRRQDPPDPPR